MPNPTEQELAGALSNFLKGFLDLLPYIVAAFLALDRRYKILAKLTKAILEKTIERKLGETTTPPPHPATVVGGRGTRVLEIAVEGLDIKTDTMTRQFASLVQDSLSFQQNILDRLDRIEANQRKRDERALLHERALMRLLGKESLDELD